MYAPAAQTDVIASIKSNKKLVKICSIPYNEDNEREPLRSGIGVGMKVKKLGSVGLAFLSAFVLSYLFAFYNELVCAQVWLTEQPVWEIFKQTKQAFHSHSLFLIFFVLFVCLFFLFSDFKRTTAFLFTYRYPIAFAVFVLCVLLQLNGSSIGYWQWLSTGDANQGLLFGVSREIRSDEWAVSTPMALSQYLDPVRPFSYYSSVVRGASTDVFLEYGQPVRNLAVIFRPFHWGYLFLPQGMGLAFYWCGRAIALFLASFEMGRILTKDNRPFSLVYACMILFAPIVQWWYAINGLMEMLIYMQYSVVLLRLYMKETGTVKKLLSLSGICICAGGYILTLYPAWQVPLAYLVLGLAIFMLVREWKQATFNRLQIAASIVCVLFFCGVLAYIFWMSKDTVRTLMNTAYPGKRSAPGGEGAFSHLFRYISSIWLPIKNTDLLENVCENAYVIDLYPLCYVFSLPALFRKKDRDPLLFILLAICIFLDLWILVGFPKFLAKITLMSFAPSIRVAQVAGFAHLMLLFRSITCSSIRLKAPIAAVLAALLAVLLCRYQPLTKPYYFVTAPTLLPLAGILFGLIFFLFLHYRRDWMHYILCGVIILVLLMGGLLVNPVRRGTDTVTQIPLYQTIREVQQKDPTALWASEVQWPAANFCMMAGARTINSTNVYPLLERWRILDPDGSNDEIYNRYAHIQISILDEGSPDFELKSPDAFTVSLTISDLKALNVSYLLAGQDLNEALEKTGDQLTLEAQSEQYYIYRIR